MPKVIKDVKGIVLCQARKILTEKGYGALNMRTLASSAGIASGTLYNYFPSKEELITAVLVKDWEAMLTKMEKAVAKVESAILGLEAIFNLIREFAAPYMPSFISLRTTEVYINLRTQYHKSIIDDLSAQILPLGERYGFLFDPTVCPFLSEVLLMAASHPMEKFKYLIPCIKRIVGEPI